ncbi:MAG: hypothetical protein JWN68_2356 [Nocardioides sp.]|jgi:hypothetical protein|uniref:hypothetical protein n=1 Tax=Nocardioides sp. TaxID=35761 RepID=UPI002614DCB0|nr:hypothetical protein [Nocardioides sp.]MCW2834403.1 hypothetical protein [Nocardioides sp.]
MRTLGTISAGGCVLLATLLASCTIGPEELEAGESAGVASYPSVADLGDASGLDALLPDGELEVAWVRAQDHAESQGVEAVVDDDGDEVVAADDAVLLVVAWQVGLGEPGTPAAVGEATVGDPAVELVLISGGVRTVLSPEEATLVQGSALVAVVDENDVMLEVTFDGVTQSVGPGGEIREVPERAAVLYDEIPTSETSIDCRPAELQPFCRADIAWLPWVASQGWAPDGQLWPVVRVEGRVPGGTGTPSLTTTLDGSPPLEATDTEIGAGRFQQLAIYPAVVPGPEVLRIEAAAGDVSITGRGDLRP